MTKKDYELIARVIKNAGSSSVNDRQFLAIAFAGELGIENPKFDRERFYKACGVYWPIESRL